ISKRTLTRISRIYANPNPAVPIRYNQRNSRQLCIRVYLRPSVVELPFFDPGPDTILTRKTGGFRCESSTNRRHKPTQKFLPIAARRCKKAVANKGESTYHDGQVGARKGNYEQ